MALAYLGMVLVSFCYGFILRWYYVGMVLVRCRYCFGTVWAGMDVVWFRYGVSICLFVVLARCFCLWFWYSFDAALVLFRYSVGIVLVWC